MRRRHERSTRAGYALLAVLWISVGITSIAYAIVVEARRAIATSRNRIALTQAGWRAEGCAASVRLTIASTLAHASRNGADSVRWQWNRFDAQRYDLDDCHVTMRPVGARFPANDGDIATLRAFLQTVGLPATRADSHAAALIDWIDADDSPQPAGAESDWYRRHGRHEPSNHPFEDLRELRSVRGFESGGLDTLFEIESEPTAIFHAIPARLAVIPGVTPDIIQRILSWRREGRSISSYRELAETIFYDRPPPETPSMDPTAEIALQPRAWITTIYGRAGQPTVTAVVELRLVLAGTDALVERRRGWIE